MATSEQAIGFRGSRKGHSTRHFTLIELLVVVAIISVLAAMLLPALMRAREMSRRAVCQSQEKQMHTGWALYTDDYDDRMASWEWLDKYVGATGWIVPPHDYHQGYIDRTRMESGLRAYLREYLKVEVRNEESMGWPNTFYYAKNTVTQCPSRKLPAASPWLADKRYDYIHYGVGQYPLMYPHKTLDPSYGTPRMSIIGAEHRLGSVVFITDIYCDSFNVSVGTTLTHWGDGFNICYGPGNIEWTRAEEIWPIGLRAFRQQGGGRNDYDVGSSTFRVYNPNLPGGGGDLTGGLAAQIRTQVYGYGK